MAEKGATTEESQETTPGNGIALVNGKAKAKESKEPVMRKVSFADLKRSTKRPDLRAVIFVDPEEIGLDREEMGYGPQDQIGLVYRPLQDNELPDILEVIRDYDEDQRQREYNDAILMRCLEDPDVPGKPYIPDTAEGRTVLKTWMTGTRDTIAQGIRVRSGLGIHEVKSAKEALGNLSTSTTSTS